MSTGVNITYKDGPSADPSDGEISMPDGIGEGPQKGIISSVEKAVESVVNVPLNALKKVVSSVKTTVGGIKGRVSDLVTDVQNGFQSIGDTITEVKTDITDIPKEATSFANSAYKYILYAAVVIIVFLLLGLLAKGISIVGAF